MIGLVGGLLKAMLKVVNRRICHPERSEGSEPPIPRDTSLWLSVTGYVTFEKLGVVDQYPSFGSLECNGRGGVYFVPYAQLGTLQRLNP